MLRKALPGRVESGESSAAEVAVDPTPEQTEQRFEHYRLVTGEDGKPVELGRGAMGVTYKAFDVDLRCPVTLKVISEKYLGDESARLRFLREARDESSARLVRQFSLSRASGSEGLQPRSPASDRLGADPLCWRSVPDPTQRHEI
jgi:hypothetical protein